MNKILPHIRTKKILVLFGAITISLILIGVSLFYRSTRALTSSVIREDLVNTVLVNATYTIASQGEVFSPAKGVITELFVDNKTEVQKNNPLFHVESTATDEEKAKTLSQYLSAKAKLDAANADAYTLRSKKDTVWKKYYDLATNGTYKNSDDSPKEDIRNSSAEFQSAQADWLAAESNYKNQQVVVTAAQAALREATLAYSATADITVDAPANGTIANLQKKKGDTVNTTIPVLVIADFSNPTLVASVNEVNLPRIKIGEKALIVFDALPDQTFSGAVAAFDEVGTRQQGTVTYSVSITADNLPSFVKPNMTASVTIETARKNNTLTVLNNAIITKNNKSYVQKAGVKKNELTEVSLGLKGLTKSEVTGGLSEGDRVIVPE